MRSPLVCDRTPSGTGAPLRRVSSGRLRVRRTRNHCSHYHEKQRLWSFTMNQVNSDGAHNTATQSRWHAIKSFGSCLWILFWLIGILVFLAYVAAQAGIALYSEWRASLWTIAVSPIIIYPLAWLIKLSSKSNGRPFLSLDTWRVIQKLYVSLTITYLIIFALSAAIGPRTLQFFWGSVSVLGMIVVPLSFLYYKYNVTMFEIFTTGGSLVFLIVSLALMFRVKDLYWSITLSLLGLIYNQLRFWMLKVLLSQISQSFQVGLNAAKDISVLKYQMGALNGESCRTEVRERVSELEKEAKALMDMQPDDWRMTMVQGAPDNVDYSVPIKNRTVDDLNCLGSTYFENLRLKLAALNAMLIPIEWDMKPRLRELTHVLVSLTCGLNLVVVSLGGRAGFWPVDLGVWILSIITRLVNPSGDPSGLVH